MLVVSVGQRASIPDYYFKLGYGKDNIATTLRIMYIMSNDDNDGETVSFSRVPAQPYPRDFGPHCFPCDVSNRSDCCCR